jgi:hypothetical protein
MRNPIVPLFFAVVIIAAVVISGQLHLGFNLNFGNGNSSAAQGDPNGVAGQPAEPVVPPTEVPTPEPTATRQAIPPELQAQIDSIEGGAAELRGLQPLDDVPETFLTRPQFREQFKKEMQATLPLEEVKQYLEELWMLRLVKDPSIDFYTTSTDLGSDGIAGQYDPVKKELFVITDKLQLDPAGQVTLAHEYVHSLQDQHYKLAKLWPVGVKDRDRELAVRALVEGDATLSGYAWAANYMNGKDFRSLFDQKSISKDVANRTPPYLGSSFIFPYTMGTEFVARIMQVGSFSTVNLSLQDPPRSTEQIMHPEKFLQVPIDHPKTVAMSDLSEPLGEGWEMKETNTLGEFDLNFMLRQNGASDPDKGADGWGGGKFAMYKLAQEIMVYSVVTWDTEKDAQEFYGSMYESFAKDPQEKETGMWTDGGRTFWLRLEGKRVVFISSTNRPALDRVVASMQ